MTFTHRSHQFLFGVLVSLFGFSVSAPALELGLGAGAVSVPHYMGSSHAYQVVVPFPIFFKNKNVFYGDKWFIFDVAADVTFPVSGASLEDALPGGYGESNKYVSSLRNYDRRGMGYLPPSIYLGLKTGVQIGPFSAVVSTTPGVKLGGGGGYAGLITKLTLTLALFADNNGKSARCLCLISDGITTDETYNETFYTVKADQVLADRPAYDAHKSGYLGTVSGVYYMYRINHLNLLAFANYQDMSDSVIKGSPLVKRISGYATGAGLAFMF